MQETKSIENGCGIERRFASRTLLAACAFTLLAGVSALTATPAAAQSDAVKELAAPPPIQLPLKPSPEFAKFPRYAGMLGNRQIVLRLGAKTDDPSGVHGEYQFVDTGEVILIAGDRDNDTLEVEESNDGTHITGNWVGKFSADGVLDGDRMNVDDSDPQPFDLHPLAAGQPLPSKAQSMSAAAAAQKQTPGDAGSAQPADATPAAGAQPAPATPPATMAPATPATPATPAQQAAPSGGHAVNGVGNLSVGD